MGGLLIARSPGRVVITDYGFFGMPIPLEQSRFTLGINYLDDLPAPLQQPVLGIETKYVFKTNLKDAEQLAHHVGVTNPGQIMDMDTNQYRTQRSERAYSTEQPLPLKRLKPLKKHTRACHTRPRLQVERDIKKYLEG